MRWNKLLSKLDEVRSEIRQVPGWQTGFVPNEHPLVEKLAQLFDEATVVEDVKVITLEVGDDGKPIIPADLQGLFATLPAEENPVVAPQRGASHKRQNAEMKIAMAPRETLHINRPPDLSEADEGSVAK